MSNVGCQQCNGNEHDKASNLASLNICMYACFLSYSRSTLAGWSLKREKE